MPKQLKSVSKSVRMTEEVAKYIDNFEGGSFNQKLENLVLFCQKEEEACRKRLSFMDGLVEDRYKVLDDLRAVENAIGAMQRAVTGSSKDLEKYLDLLQTRMQREEETL